MVPLFHVNVNRQYPLTATRAPSREQIKLMALPIPRPAPVTTTRWFMRRAVGDMAGTESTATVAKRRAVSRSCGLVMTGS